jgi:hypothetical protein
MVPYKPDDGSGGRRGGVFGVYFIVVFAAGWVVMVSSVVVSVMVSVTVVFTVVFVVIFVWSSGEASVVVVTLVSVVFVVAFSSTSEEGAGSERDHMVGIWGNLRMDFRVCLRWGLKSLGSWKIVLTFLTPESTGRDTETVFEFTVVMGRRE